VSGGLQGRSPACPSGTDVRSRQRQGQPCAPGPGAYPNQMMSQDDPMHNHHPHQMAKAQQQQQFRGDYRTPNSVALAQQPPTQQPGQQPLPGEVPDLALSEILDQVIDIVPESGGESYNPNRSLSPVLCSHEANVF